jgi:iron complex outermembrane receptor protein
MKYSTFLKYTASAVTVAMACGSAAFAQSTSTAAVSGGAADAEGQNVSEVVVTGSRVATGAEAPTPVTVVTPEAINQVDLPNIADALVQLPALRSSTTASKGGQGPILAPR